MAIACTTDCSDASRRACETAALLASRMNASLCLVHVLSSNMTRTLGQGIWDAAREARGWRRGRAASAPCA